MTTGVHVRFDRVRSLSHAGHDASGFAFYTLSVPPEPGSIVNIRGNPYVVLAGGGWAYDAIEGEVPCGPVKVAAYYYVRILPAFETEDA